MAIRIKYGNPLDIADMLRERRRRMQEEADQLPPESAGSRLREAVRDGFRDMGGGYPAPPPAQRLESQVLGRRRQRRQVEEEGRRAARERRSAQLARSRGEIDRRTDAYFDQRDLARKAWEQQLSDRSDAEAYYRGQNSELMSDLFDIDRSPGEGWAFTPSQKVELQQIAQTANELISDPSLTEEERYRGLSQLQSKRDLIRPNKVEQPPPTAKEEWQNQTVPMHHPETGEFMGWAAFNRNGGFSKVADYSPPKPEQAEDPEAAMRERQREWALDYAKIYRDEFRTRVEAAKLRDPTGTEPLDTEAIERESRRAALAILGDRPGGEVPFGVMASAGGPVVAAPGGVGPPAPAGLVPEQGPAPEVLGPEPRKQPGDAEIKAAWAFLNPDGERVPYWQLRSDAGRDLVALLDELGVLETGEVPELYQDEVLEALKRVRSVQRPRG